MKKNFANAYAMRWEWTRIINLLKKRMARYAKIARMLKKHFEREFRQSRPAREISRLRRAIPSVIAGGALAFAIAVTPVHAATITVTGTGDAVAADGQCTLREAIQAANTNLAVNECGAGSAGLDTVQMSSITGTITLTADLPDITQDISFVGPGAASLAVDGDNKNYRTFYATGVGTDVNVQDMTVSNSYYNGVYSYEGDVTVSNSTVSGNDGHGIYSKYGDMVTVSNSTVSGNYGNGIYGYSYKATVSNSTVSENTGHGVYAYADAMVSDSIVTRNDGNGIYSKKGDVTLTDSTVSGNGSEGIVNMDGIVNVSGSTVSDNGWHGIYAYEDITVSNSTVSGNFRNGISVKGYATVSSSTVSGNGVAGNGHGVYSYKDATVSNSTVSGNGVASNGHGVYSYDGYATVSNSTVSGNKDEGIYSYSGGTVTNSIVAGNNGGTGDIHVLMSSGGHNLIGVVGTFTTGPGDIVNPNPMLGPLANNGGTTMTHALLTGSPAIDKGDDAATTTAGLTTDQRGAGFPRINGIAVDIGAYESVATPPPPAGLPAAPSGLTAEPVSHEAIRLAWTDNSDNETGFIIERWSLGADWVTVGVAGADAKSYIDSPLSYSWEYHYRIRAYNAGGNSDYSNETFAITWFHPYETCKGVTLNGSAAVHGSAWVQENAAAGTVIGTFGTVEPTGGHRYEFFPAYVPGIDNGFFVIDGNVLKTGGNTKPDYEEKKELRVSLLSIDSGTPYAWCHAEFVIAVTDVPEAPTFLHLSNYGGSVPENQPGSFVANIVTEDDPGDTHSYSLVSGEGDTDNALFRIEGNTLKTGPGIDYETKQNVSVRIRTTDQTAAYFERFIVLTVRNTPDPPVLSDIANVSTDDDIPASVKFKVSDQDTALTSLTVSAKSDNAAVLPNANIAVSGNGADRTLTLTPVKGKAGSAKITVTLTDGEMTAEKSFTLTVTTGPGLRAVTRIESPEDGTLVAGDTLRYSASITNDGDRDVSGVVFTVPLPEGTAYAGPGKRSDSGIAYDSESNQAEWTGDVPAGETVEVAFSLTVKSGGSIAFSDAEIAYDSDGDGVNDAVRKADNDAGMTALFAVDCQPGDIDADGEITLKDAVLVLQILSGSDAEVCPDADVNNDGQTGIAEAVFILNELAK